jgi:hypothetical protein
MSDKTSTGDVFFWLFVVAIVVLGLWRSLQPRAPEITYEQWERANQEMDRIEREHGGIFIRTPPPGSQGYIE